MAAVVDAAGAGEIPRFVVSGLALAGLAAVIGQAIEQAGDRLGPGATGLLQSTLGNLPELFVGIFALRDGLYNVVRAALAGSVLSNALLVLGLAFVAGGLRHGVQRFDPAEPRLNATLLILAVAALLVPTLARELHTPAAPHTAALSNATSVVLLVVYAASIPFYLRQVTTAASSAPAPAPAPAPSAGAASPHSAGEPPGRSGPWPLGLSTLVLAVASLAAAWVSDQFVAALVPASRSLGLSQTFTGLVIVAIASNA
ncbi:MAG: hypothetical protein J2P57_03570, partial [Acidimicrobiaceae bacterium]|nr:hypothetical protein [Acidimicrobiaceae bacterium]